MSPALPSLTPGRQGLNRGGPCSAKPGRRRRREAGRVGGADGAEEAAVTYICPSTACPRTVPPGPLAACSSWK